MATDKKLLNSISNFAKALENLVDELKKKDDISDSKNSITYGIFGKNGISKTMKRIEVGIKKIKQDTNQIIKNQKELLKLSKARKREKDNSLLSSMGDDKSNNKIKDGVGTIILIAGGILAIGMAFKIIGKVDVISVLALSFAVTLIGTTLSKLYDAGVPSLKESLALGLSLLSFTTAIVLSSYVLEYMNPISDKILFNVLKTGLVLGGLAIVMSIPMFIISKMGSSMIKGALLSVLVFPLMSLSIALSSMALSMGDYSTEIPISWFFSFGVGMLIMTVPIAIMGLIPLPIMLLGSLSLLAVSATIAASSQILKKGDYTGGPSKDWSVGVGLAFLSFVPAMIALGTVLAIPIVGAMLLKGGIDAMAILSNSIVSTSKILKKGDYTGGPSKEWAEGIGLAIGAFAPVFNELNKSKIFELFGIGKSSNTGYSDTIKLIGQSILDVADLFSKNSTKWGNYPSKDWSEGVGLAISAFAPVYKNLNSSFGGIIDKIFGNDDTSEKMKNAMVAIANGIISVNDELSGAKFNKIDMKPEWAESISYLISGFSKAYQYIIDENIDAEDIIKAQPVLMLIASSISPISNLIGKLSEINGINVDLVEISKGVISMAESIEKLSDSLENLSLDKVNGLRSLTTSLLGISIVSPENLSNVLDTISEKETELKKLVEIANSSKDNFNFGNIFSSIKDVLPNINIENNNETNKLEEKLDMVISLLSQISNNSTTISSQLNSIRNEMEDDTSSLNH